jgi:CDP-paratose 2-epimerase
MTVFAQTTTARPILITGGAGFIGTNLASRLLREGHQVIVFDNLSRAGVERNLGWLTQTYGTQVRVIDGDIRDLPQVSRAVRDAEKVFHLAAQVAVTTSLSEPSEDFEINARGTLHVLEAIRRLERPIPLLFTSTNKVYGDLRDLELKVRGDRYQPATAHEAKAGVDEACGLSFHSPYGCSKGAADQYVLDYARTFGLPAVVFRMSCIYGPHQCGNEDQGWVAHFIIKALRGEPVVLYGDGRQVRDVLFVDDLVEAMTLAQRHIDRISGQAFNIGGGPSHTISLLELLNLIDQLARKPPVRFEGWRPADQRYYVSDISRFTAATGWRPSTSVRDGVAKLMRWLVDHPTLGTPATRTALATS